MYKAGHAFTYLLRGRRPAARASDLRVVRTGPVCCEPRHRQLWLILTDFYSFYIILIVQKFYMRL